MVAYLDQAGVQHLIAKIRNTFWPVGTILATSTNTSPASEILYRKDHINALDRNIDHNRWIGIRIQRIVDADPV
jgi:hypothetical protein